MRFLPDSRLPFLLLALCLATPALAARHAAAPAAPADPVADLIAQAQAAQSRGENELAVRLAQSAIVAGPARTDAYDALAGIYAANGQPDAARTYYDEALSIDPADPAALKAQPGLERSAKASTGTP